MALSLLVMVAGAALALRPEQRCRSLDAPLLFGASILAVSTAFSPDLSLSLFGRDGSWSLGLWALALYAALFFLASAAPVSLTALSWLGVAISAHALLQRAGFDPLVALSHLPSGYRSIGTVGNPNELGAILAMILLSRNNMLHPCQLFILAGLWATGSRGAWLATCAGLAAMHLPRWSRWIAAASVFLLLWSGSSPSDRARREVWRAAVSAIAESPAVGHGPDTFIFSFRKHRRPEFNAALGNASHTQANAHNDLLQAAATAGLPGLLAYIFLWLSLPPIPPLVALFVGLKVNVFSFKVLALGALLAGTAMSRKAPGCPRTPPGFRPPRWPWLALACLGALSCFACLRIYASERAAARHDYTEAVSWWSNVDYIGGMVNQKEIGYLDAATAYAKKHPADAMAWYALAVAQLRSGVDPRPAARVAQNLDPQYPRIRGLLVPEK